MPYANLATASPSSSFLARMSGRIGMSPSLASTMILPAFSCEAMEAADLWGMDRKAPQLLACRLRLDRGTSEVPFAWFENGISLRGIKKVPDTVLQSTALCLKTSGQPIQRENSKPSGDSLGQWLPIKSQIEITRELQYLLPRLMMTKQAKEAAIYNTGDLLILWEDGFEIWHPLDRREHSGSLSHS